MNFPSRSAECVHAELCGFNPWPGHFTADDILKARGEGFRDLQRAGWALAIAEPGSEIVILGSGTVHRR